MKAYIITCWHARLGYVHPHAACHPAARTLRMVYTRERGSPPTAKPRSRIKTRGHEERPKCLLGVAYHTAGPMLYSCLCLFPLRRPTR